MYLLIDFEKEIVDLDSLSKAELETFFGFDSAADPVLDFFTLILEAFLTAFFLKYILAGNCILPGIQLIYPILPRNTNSRRGHLKFSVEVSGKLVVFRLKYSLEKR